MNELPSSAPSFTADDQRVLNGQAVYTPGLLKSYDVLVLGISNRFIWRCPTPRLLAWYDRHISNKHLDVGVGTGYFLDRCRFQSAQPEVALMDLNENSLRATAERICRYRPATYRRNVLEPIDVEGRTFDSIGVNYLLHCLPGNMQTKAAVFAHLQPLLNPGGVLFGSTLLGRNVRRNFAARRLMAFYNRKGVFTNTEDDLDGLRAALEQSFANVTIETAGCGALFAAK